MRLWVLVAVAMLFAGPAVAGGSRLRVAVLDAIASFDPDDTRVDSAAAPLNAVYEGLLDYAPGSNALVARLATGWTVSPDGLGYRFAIRPGVRFHDGAAMTSADVAAALLRRRDGRGRLADTLANVAAVTAPDTGSVMVTLSVPQASFLDMLAGPFGPRVAHVAADAPAGELASHDAGTGPYALAAFDRETGVLLRRFDGYWGAPPHFGEVEVAVEPDIARQVLRLRGGALDAVLDGYPAALLPGLPDGLALEAQPAMAMLVGFVNPHGRLAQPELRGPVRAALNPRFWLRAAYGPYASPSGTLFPASMFETWDPVEPPDDLDVALKTIRRIGGADLTLGYPAAQAALLGVPVQQMLSVLRAVGIDATARPFAAQDIAQFARDPAQAPDLFLSRITPDSAHPDSLARRYFGAGARGNLFGFASAEAERLLRSADAAPQARAANRLYERAAGQMIAGFGFIPLGEPQSVVVHRASLTGIVLRPSYPPGAIEFARLTELP